MKTPSRFAPRHERSVKQPLAAASSLSHDAAGAAAGFLFQPERALFWLAEAADPDARVGIEAFGDVFVSFPDAPGIHEEDKHSVQADGHPLGDHDPRLWRTLEIWSDATLNGTQEQAEARLLLVTNRPVRQEPGRSVRGRGKRNGSTRPARLLVLQLAAAWKKDECHRCISRMRHMADVVPDSLDGVYNRVMSYDDDILTSVIKRFELWDGAGTSAADLRRKIVGRLHLPSDIDADHVIRALSGWLHEVVLAKWRRREPAWIPRKSFDIELDRIRLRLKREKVLARSATRLPPLEPGEKESARQERFVEHLARIAVDDEELDLAIEDYLRFGIEHLRLLNSGEVLITDWEDRAGQLQDRWKRIARQARRRNGDIDSTQLGQDILEDTLSPDYIAPLAGEPQPEPYFTRGHYHRIADEDRVWWYPCDQPDY
jgi:hypothetical protein